MALFEPFVRKRPKNPWLSQVLLGACKLMMIIGCIVSILCMIFVIINLLACFWHWVGTQSLPHTGCLP
jgi:hypothetical protein